MKKESQVHDSYLAQEEYQGTGTTEGLPGAGNRKDLLIGSIDPEVSHVRYPLGVKRMLTFTAESVLAPCTADSWLLPPVAVLKERRGAS